MFAPEHDTSCARCAVSVAPLESWRDGEKEGEGTLCSWAPSLLLDSPQHMRMRTGDTVHVTGVCVRGYVWICCICDCWCM